MKLRGDSTPIIIIIVIAIFLAWKSGMLASLTQAGAIYPPVSMAPPANMSMPGSDTLSKFVGALSAPAPQPPTLGDIQGQAAPVNAQPLAAPGVAPAAVQPAPNYVNPAATIGKNDISNPDSAAYKQAVIAAATESAKYIVLTPPAQGKWVNADTSAAGYAQNNAAVQANIATLEQADAEQVRVEVQQVTGDKLLYTPAGWFRCIVVHGADAIQGTENDRQLWFSLPAELRQKAASLCAG